MAHEKQYTAKQAAFAVLEKVGELLKKSESLEKAEQPGKIQPKEKEQAPPDGVRAQVAPEFNPKEQQEGNNAGPGVNPHNEHEEYGDLRGHIKLAKFIGHMGHKRLSKAAPADPAAPMAKKY